jgi:hypothetical protein
MIRGARGIEMERHEAHNEGIIQNETAIEVYLVPLRHIRTAMTQGARQTGVEKNMVRIPQTIHIIVIFNIWAVIKHFLVVPVLKHYYEDRIEVDSPN